MQAISIQNSRLCPPVISMTTTAEVIGDCVAPARNAAMQMRTMMFAPCDMSAMAAICSPKTAPMVSEGVKMPPGMPAQ